MNENAMGNISQLQAEIRALKEELKKYKSGVLVQQPGPAGLILYSNLEDTWETSLLGHLGYK